MRKTTVCLMVFISVTITANAQIPNNGFDTWENYSDPSPPYNVYQKPEGWIGFLPSSPLTYSFSIEKNPESFPIGTGQYSMKIKNDLSNDVNGVALSYDTVPSTDLKATWPNVPPGFPVSFRPNSFCLYYKYLPVSGDSMRATCYFYKNGKNIGDATYVSSQNVPTWTPLIIPVAFSTSDVPDSATIVFTVANDLSYQHPGSTLYVDNLSFDNLITSVYFSAGEFPRKFNLAQNYPNPFNPSTTISFGLPSKSFVSLKIFDALGREVSTITAEELPGGHYSRQWNAEGLPSGVYFYRLQAGTLTETKKLILLR